MPNRLYWECGAIITDCASGIGRCLAINLHKRGYRCSLLDRALNKASGGGAT
jgi:hypothetical protein